jgi:hypothetical protein
MNNSLQCPFQKSHQHTILCKLASLNMGGPSSDPIRCVKQNNESKDPSRGICPKGNNESKEPFTSKCDSGMCWAYFMAYGVIESIFMSAFVEVCLLLSYHFLSDMFF